MEFIFFTAARTVLWFGSVGWTPLIPRGGHTTSGPLPLPTPAHRRAAGCARSWAGTRRDSWPQQTNEIAHTVWRHAHRRQLGEDGGSGGCLEGWRLSPQATVRRDGALLARRRLNTCLPMGWANEFLLLLCLHTQLLLYLWNYLCLSARVFPLFPFWLSPRPTGWQWASGWLPGRVHTASRTADLTGTVRSPGEPAARQCNAHSDGGHSSYTRLPLRSSTFSCEILKIKSSFISQERLKTEKAV